MMTGPADTPARHREAGAVAAHRKRGTGDERRAAIAAAVRALIIEKGFEGLRTRDIAARVGINIATLHYHVPSKQALIELVADAIRAEFDAHMHARPRQGLAAIDQLRLEFDAHAHKVFHEPEWYMVLGELTDRARRDESVRAVIEPLRRQWRERIAAILRKGVAEGDFRPDVDPDAGARIVTGALISFRGLSAPDRESHAALCDELLRAFRGATASGE